MSGYSRRAGVSQISGGGVTHEYAAEVSGTMEPDPGGRSQILADAEAVIRSAGAEGLRVRLIGGVGIYLRSSAGTRSALGRSYGDFDLVARRKESRQLRRLLEALKFVPETVFNATHGESRLLYHHPSGAYHVDVFLDEFNMSHKLDFSNRLDVVPLTLPPSDLLLTKMQVAQINQKDLSDAAMLLLDHIPGEHDGEADLASEHFAETLARDWGLYTTVTDNLRLLMSAVAALPLNVEDRELIAGRASELVRVAEAAPKSTRWQMRSRVGRRVRWYELPEDIG